MHCLPPVVLTLLQSSSPGSSAHHEDEGPPLDASHAVAQLSDAVPVVYPPPTRTEEHLDTVESSQGVTKIRKWLQMWTKKNNRDPTLHEHDRVPRKSRRPANGRSSPQSAARVDTTNKGPSRMAAGIRVRVSTLPW